MVLEVIDIGDRCIVGDRVDQTCQQLADGDDFDLLVFLCFLAQRDGVADDHFLDAGVMDLFSGIPRAVRIPSN